MPQGGEVTDVASVAYDALNLARQVERDIESHEELCAERYAGIHEKIHEIKSLIGWAGGVAFSIIVAVLGFLAVQMLSANDQARRDQQTKIDLLQQQLIDARAGQQKVTP